MSDLITNGLNSMYANNTYQTNKKNAELEKTLTSDLSNASDEELMKVCKEFEAYFVEQMFKSMQKMVPKAEDETSASSPNNTLTDYFKDELTSEYAKNAVDSNGGKGYGLAGMLYEQMKRNLAPIETE